MHLAGHISTHTQKTPHNANRYKQWKQHGHAWSSCKWRTLFKMPNSTGARGVNTSQMSTEDPKSQMKLAVICTNIPLCLAHKTYTYPKRYGFQALTHRVGLLQCIHSLGASTNTFSRKEGQDGSRSLAW